MADAQGDIVRTFAFLVIKGVTKTNTAITLGELLAYDTDGWAPAANTMYGPFGMALNTQIAASGVQKEAQVLVKGACRLSKKTGTAIAQGDGVMISSDAGDVTVWAVADVSATPVQATINAAILDACQCAGHCIKDAASGATFVDVVLT